MKHGIRNFFLCLGALSIALEISGLPGPLNSDLAHAADGTALPPAAPVAAVYQPLNEQVEVFVVDANGALNVVWKDNNGSWKAPFPLTSANFTIPGASIAAIYYPTYQQLEVFVVDKNGVLNVVWKDHNGPWHAPVGLTDPGFAPPGAPLAAVYQPLNRGHRTAVDAQLLTSRSLQQVDRAFDILSGERLAVTPFDALAQRNRQLTPGWLLRNAPATPVSAQYGQRGIRAPSRPRAGGAECSARQWWTGLAGEPAVVDRAKSSTVLHAIA